MFTPVRCSLFALIACCLVACGGDETDPYANVDLVVEARRVAASKPLTAQEAEPYPEALAWHQYELVKVIKGSLPKRVKSFLVGHWAVIGQQDKQVDTGVGAVSTIALVPPFPGWADVKATLPEEYDDDLPRYVEAYQGSGAVPAQLRNDYGSIFSKLMSIYNELRPQLKVVIMGNSHTGVGVEPARLMLPENATTPCVISLAAPGSHMPYQCLLIRDYVKDLPKLEWVVWGVSTRSFNKERSLNHRMNSFLMSPGRKWDEANWGSLWPVQDAPPKTFAELADKGWTPDVMWDYWSEKKKRTFPVPLDDATRQKLLKTLGRENSVWWEEAWAEFETTVDALASRGIKVLLFTPPTHPVSQESVAIDADQTSRADHAKLIEKLTALGQSKAKVWFHDFNKGGAHGLLHEDFYDIDHLWPQRL
jgi:hypothetical protein